MDMTKVKELWEKVKGFFKNMSMKVRIILCAAVTVLLVAIIALAVWSSSRDTYTTLFTNLSSSYLQENNFTDYRLEGDTIFVRAGQEDILTAQLVQAGYPKNGALYETYFDKVGMTTTQSEANEIKRIALEQRWGPSSGALTGCGTPKSASPWGATRPTCWTTILSTPRPP